MNNPLAQKYNYYLNESNRLSEELQNEVEYSEILENVLFELLGEEDFTKLFEDLVNKNKKFKGKLTSLKNPHMLDKKIKSGKKFETPKAGKTVSITPKSKETPKPTSKEDYGVPASEFSDRDKDSWEKRPPRTRGEIEAHKEGLTRLQHRQRIRGIVDGRYTPPSDPKVNAQVKREFTRANLADIYKKHTGRDPLSY